MADPVPRPYTLSDEPRDLTDDDLRFLGEYTGNSDYTSLREHVLKVWREGKAKLWVYKCVQELMFLKPRLGSHPAAAALLEDYKSLASQQKEDGDPFLLEVGSCFGTDTRWLVLTGIRPHDIIATDLTPDYWNFGFELYGDKERLRVRSFFGSMTDDSLVSQADAGTPLARYRGRVHYVWAGMVLHVLSQEGVEGLLRNVHLLLRPSGTFLGVCVGAHTARPWFPTPDGKSTRYLHSADSLTELLQKLGFTDVLVTSRGHAPADVDKLEPSLQTTASLTFTAKAFASSS